MEQTRIIPPGGGDPNDRTQAMADVGKTAMVGAVRALEMDVIAGNRYVLSNEPSRDHVMLQLRSSASMMGRRLPLNIALVIDRSGSMEGEPLDYVKRACGYVVDLLDQNDILSVVTFEEQVDVIMPARRVVNKTLIKEHINRIEPGNTTNLYDGIVVGANQVASAVSAGCVNRVLLFSDGDPTAGIKDFGSIVGQVAEQKSRGITVTALGFGPDYNEELIAGIARQSGGNYYYISRPDLIPEVFRRELESLMTIIARDMKLRLNLSRWVQLRQVYGRKPSFSGRSAEVPLVDMERGSAMSVLCEMEFAPRPAGTYRVAKAELFYEDTSSGRSETIAADIEFDFTSDRALVQANVNPIIAQEIEIAQASRNLEKTVMGMKTQQLSAMTATMELQKTMSLLASQGRTDEAEDVRKAIESIQQGGPGAEKTLIGTIYSLDQGKRKE
ncbi:MAG: VWA domain-containing protein [Armatimonadetes bacterium]|nr:VWA domain-containing protein [Armatimonadota bacterium]